MLDKIRSKKVLNLIFIKLIKRKKLKVLKYNKNMLNKLNISLKDFEQYKLLKELNLKYNLNIEDVDVEIVNTKDKNIDDEFLNYLSKIKFNQLKQLILYGTFNLQLLEKTRLNKLEKLVFHQNKNLYKNNILQKLNFKELKELNLSQNELTNLDLLKKVNFEKLESLDLSIISNIFLLQ